MTSMKQLILHNYYRKIKSHHVSLHAQHSSSVLGGSCYVC